MEFITILHDGLQNALWLFFLLIGLWGTYKALQGEGVDGSWIGAFYIGIGIVLIQAVLTGILWFNGRLTTLQDPEIHFLYLAFAILFPPFIYQVVLKGDDSNRGMWVMSFTTLFMFGIAVRLINTSFG
ncbi:MAG: hypothetical protein AB8G95_09450 [Anaerolineae bacterium]